jgi:dienelactone hydrolase
MGCKTRFWILVVWVLIVAGCTTGQHRKTIGFAGLDTPSKHFIGHLTLPVAFAVPLPAVMLVHGSAGVDSRYDFHRPALLAAGMATFEVDFKTGVFTNLSNRPPIATFLPWVFGALQTLRAHPAIDPERIAIMGFSLGGHLAISAASRQFVERWMGDVQQGFAAHVGFYPVCRWLRSRFNADGCTGAPMLILTAGKDSWGDGETCPPFEQWINTAEPGLLELIVYPGVHHGFDRRGTWRGYAPLARNYSAVLQWNSDAAHDSRHRATAFLQSVFGLQ